MREVAHFSYDDGYLPGDIPPYIRAIRTAGNWLYAVYFNDDGSAFEYEMYDIDADPHQDMNLVGLASHERQLISLHIKLQRTMNAAGTAPAGIPLVSPQLQAEQSEPATTLSPTRIDQRQKKQRSRVARRDVNLASKWMRVRSRREDFG